MLKELMCNLLKFGGEEMAKVSANDASVWMCYQEEEPVEVREKFVKEEEY